MVSCESEYIIWPFTTVNQHRRASPPEGLFAAPIHAWSSYGLVDGNIPQHIWRNSVLKRRGLHHLGTPFGCLCRRKGQTNRDFFATSSNFAQRHQNLYEPKGQKLYSSLGETSRDLVEPRDCHCPLSGQTIPDLFQRDHLHLEFTGNAPTY